ncbi:C4-dicarboxylate transporter DctA, partial [Xanthomonas oryzae pv. oryzae]
MHISKPAGPLPASVPFYRQLYFQVVVAIILGALLGRFEPAFAESLKPLGDAFIKLVKMIIAPVIFLTIVTGIAGMTHLKTVGRVFGKAMVYFLFFSTLALVVGLVVAHVVQPGAGMNINPADLDQSAVKSYVEKSHDLTLVGFLMDIIPNSLIGAFTGDQVVNGKLTGPNILQVLFVAVLFGVSLALVGERGKPVLNLLEALIAPVFKLVHILMRAAPIGAFGAIAFTIGKYGVESLVNLAWLVGSFYLTSLLFVLVILGVVCRLCGFSVLKLIRYLKAELLLVLGTSSSESALPSLMEKMEKAGCEKSVVGLVVPTGYSFNLDGTNIYMTLAALFIAQATNTELTLGHQIALLAVAMLSSKGAAGVTGAGFITLAATLAVVPEVPVAGMALILGVDRFMSECRSLTNFIGNAVA